MIETTKPPGIESRVSAARVLFNVVYRQWTVERAVGQGTTDDQALVRELVGTTLRYWHSLDVIWTHLRGGHTKRDEPLLRCLGLLGLAQLFHTRIPAHAAVDVTVEAARRLNRRPLVPLLNAVLRRACREREQLTDLLSTNSEYLYAHPGWWIDLLSRDWPCDWPSILQQSLKRAPLTLRVNVRRTDREHYRHWLAQQGIAATPTRHSSLGLVLETPRPAQTIPGFAEGLVSIQDEAAQLAVSLLECREGDRILDACAAPGNKLSQLLETSPPTCRFLGLDISPRRLAHCRQELRRLGHDQAELRVADAGSSEALSRDEQFDRILLDVPCTASGTIRRHPEIKISRKSEHVAQRADLALRLLDNLWQHLRAGGRLLYASCSLFRAETDQVIYNFLERHPKDAKVYVPSVLWGHRETLGIHVLTGEDDMDGFFYSILLKTAEHDHSSHVNV